MVLSGIYLAGNIISDDLIVADFSQKGLKPSWKHPFGTDMLGRDMLVRTIKGLSVSITVGTVASSVSAVIALIVGVVAATGAVWMDNFINWLIDLVMGIPHTVLLILISFACGKGLKGVLYRCCSYSLRPDWRVLFGVRCCRYARSSIFRVSRKLAHSSWCDYGESYSAAYDPSVYYWTDTDVSACDHA